jgi:formate hydrogenlyase subunit 3
LALSEFHLATLSRGLASWVFVLGLLGFGIVSGLVPLHGWIPQVHSSAPSHAATLVSSVMLKVGLFGLLKLSIDWLGMPQLWWGAALMIIGALTAFIGGLYALMEHDIKRLLAYHTVENIGIILLGLSACVLGLALGKPTLAVLGLMAGLFHLVNHTLFKGVLFLGAGAVIRSTGAKDIEKLGGVARRMPLTATAMLIGLMSMAALPPLNGFVSEWFTYQTLFSLSHSSILSMRIIAPLVMVVLAITGALAVMCVAKIFGVTFLGAPRSEGAANAGCAPASMLFSPVLLAIGCLTFGIGAPWVLPYMLKIAAGSLGLMLDPHQMTQGAVMISGTANTTLLSTPMIAILLLAFPIIPMLLVGMYKNARLPRRRHGDAWACGYGHEAGMVVTATGFAQPLRVMFAPVYRLRQVFNPAPLLGGLLREGAMRIYPALAVIELALLLVAIFA